MSKKNLRWKIDELQTSLGTFKNLDISIGKLVMEDWNEQMGPTPFPSVTDLRNWDHTLLERYEPFYMPFCDLCCLCTFGKCDLTGDKKGACGINMEAQQSRIVLLAACIGASCHAAHARHLLEHLKETSGEETALDIAMNTELEAPNIRLVCGVRPRTLADLTEVLDYIDSQLVHLMSSCHTGQEGSNLDFESKAFHAGMLDHVALEVADIAQIAALGFPKGDPEAPLVEMGIGSIDKSKPMIMVIGHNVLPSVDIIDYLMEKGLVGQIEVGGLCCTAHDMTRYNKTAKIVGPISWQLRYIRTGRPDLIVVDEQCIRTDVLDEARKIGTPVIATNDKSCLGLPDLTYQDPEMTIAELVEGKREGALILDPKKVGRVAVESVLKIAPKRTRKTLTREEIQKELVSCRGCQECERACPNTLPIQASVKAAALGDFTGLESLYDLCVGCGRCEQACPQEFPIISYINEAAGAAIGGEKYAIRSGRGPIQDVEIREVGRSIVLGEIPGVLALVGCSNYPEGGEDVAKIAEEFLKRRFIVVTTGCSAMSIGSTKDEEGQTLYERYPGTFDGGSLLNIGSCVANSHISGAAIKIANIFAKRPLRGNYEEIADYIYNRVGAVGVAWGAMSQKAAAIAAGCWRLGIPVVVGPHGAKYRRMLLGRKENDDRWYVWDTRTGKKAYIGPSPEHLFYAAETVEEALVMIAKLSMRPNDTSKGRAVKLNHYVDLHKKYYGKLPDDLPLFVRKDADIPFTMKTELVAFLEQAEWKPERIQMPDPTLLERMIRRKEQ